MRAAILQATSGVDPSANAVLLEQSIARAKAAGADMLFSPEMVGCLDRDRARAAENLRDEASDLTLRAAQPPRARHGA